MLLSIAETPAGDAQKCLWALNGPEADRKPVEDTRTPAMGISWKTGLSSVFVQMQIEFRRS